MQIIKKEPNIIIFESPASKRIIKYYDSQGKMHSFYLSMPRMRFYSVGEKDAWLTPRLLALYVNFIGSDNLCYPAILPNIGYHGNVCLGETQYIRLCEKNIYNSFLSSAFDAHGLLLLEFLFGYKKILNLENVDFYFIEFLNLWKKNGLDFQDLNFVYHLQNLSLYKAMHLEEKLFKTYMSLAQ